VLLSLSRPYLLPLAVLCYYAPMINAEEGPRILILRGGAVGDFVLTFPVFDALRAHWPAAHITLACYPRVAGLALSYGLADETLSLDSAQFARLFAPATAGGVPGGFDIIVSYLNDPDGIVRENLLQSGTKRVICGSPLPASGHAADWLMRPLAELGLRLALPAIPRIRNQAAFLRRAEGTLAAIMAGAPETPRRPGIIAIHPGSGSPAKNWPADRFCALAGKLYAAANLAPLFILGEADSAARTSAAAIVPSVPVLPTCGLDELAAALACCAGYVGNDSGITHLAAAAGIPVVALFGPTDPAAWGPRGPNVRIIKAGGRLAAIEPDAVMNQLLQLGY